MSEPSSRLVVIEDFPDRNPALSPARSHAIYIYLPANYHESTERYPVVYLHDGLEMFRAPKPWQVDDQVIMLDVVLDDMVAQGKARPAILVGVAPSTQVGRAIELVPLAREDDKLFGMGRGGGNEDYYQFLATQLKPYIDAHYRTNPAPDSTGVGGASFGGIASLVMCQNHPETFGLCFCMSPSLWWDQEKFLLDLETDSSSKTDVKYWICAGTQESRIMWGTAQRAAAALIRRGWVEGRDVAFYHDYIGLHDYAQWKASAFEMFRFLLGTEPMTLTGVAIHQVQDPAGRPIKALYASEEPYLSLELFYEGGYRHNAAHPQIISQDPSVVEIISEGPLAKIQSQGQGLTILRGQYDRFTCSQFITGHAPVPENYPRIHSEPVEKSLDVDAPLSDWPAVVHSLEGCLVEPPPPGARITPIGQDALPLPEGIDLSLPPCPAPQCRFGVWDGPGGLYIGIEVIKPEIHYAPNILPWHQDGIELRIDAQSDPVRYCGRGEKEGEKFLLLGLSPAPDGSKQTLYQPEKLPVGTRISCKRTDRGYTLQVLIPSQYLDASQKKPWTDCRINLVINAPSAAGAYPWKYFWQPDWRSKDNIPGSGTFARTPRG